MGGQGAPTGAAMGRRRPGTVPIKQVLNAPNSGSRTYFGDMVMSTKSSSAKFSIGSSKRGAAHGSHGESCSPGPVYNFSAGFGKAPCFSMGTSQRAQLAPGSRYVPGPDAYTVRGSVGYQVESFKSSSPSTSVGREGRAQHTGKRNPVYTDTIFPSVSSLGQQRLSGCRTASSIPIGTDSRFKSGAAEQAPGPGNYKMRSSIGNQIESNLKSSQRKSFGVRCHIPNSYEASPGPAGYRQRDSIGKQVKSSNRTACSPTIGTAPRFPKTYVEMGPGPGTYTI